MLHDNKKQIVIVGNPDVKWGDYSNSSHWLFYAYDFETGNELTDEYYTIGEVLDNVDSNVYDTEYPVVRTCVLEHLNHNLFGG